MTQNCLNCKYFDCYGPAYNLKIEKELNICWKNVNIERSEPPKYVENPEAEHECFVCHPKVQIEGK